MSRITCVLLLSPLLSPVVAQTTAFFPSDHANVDGSTYERSLPFSGGATYRTMFVYDPVDLQVPNGAGIVDLGFRRDGTVVSLGNTIELQVFMGRCSGNSATCTSTFANNYAGPAVEVFTRKSIRLPDLGNPLNPNPNGDLVILHLDTPWVHDASQSLVVEYRVYSNATNAAFTYQLDKGTFLSPTSTYGQGCVGSNTRVPRLTGSTASVPGTWTLTFANGLGNSVVVLFVGPGSAPGLPLLHGLGAPGCDVFVDPLQAVGLTWLTSSGGAFTANLTVPGNVRLNDVWMHAQVLTLDPAANTAGIAVSNAWQTQLGMLPQMTTIHTSSTTATTGTVRRNNGIVSLFRHL